MFLVILVSTIVSANAGPITDSHSVSETELPGLEVHQYSGADTENQLTDGSPCRAVTIIFARGTTESGNVGNSAGPTFFQAVADSIGTSNLAVQGVAYPADTVGFLVGGDADGSRTFADLVQVVRFLVFRSSLLLNILQGGDSVPRYQDRDVWI